MSPRARKPKRMRRARPAEFNHAMIYSRDLPRALAFYRDLLGFRLIEAWGDAYARLQSPRGRTTIALHRLEQDRRMDAAGEGLRLYFEVADLDAFCGRLAADGVAFRQMPQDMPWGWRHAYLHDPDGHELSLYAAGAKRLRKTAVSRR